MSERNYKKHIPLHIYCTELDNNNDILLWFRFFALMTPRQGIILKQTQRAGDTKFRIFPNKQKIDLVAKSFDLLKSMYNILHDTYLLSAFTVPNFVILSEPYKYERKTIHKSGEVRKKTQMRH